MDNLVVLSGGLDSTGALAIALQTDPKGDTRAISFDYGQRHAKELDAARQIARYMGVPHGIVNLHDLLHGSALLFAADVPHGHYEAETMAATVVHGRNLLFASAAIAAANENATVWFGVHAGDHAIYPDCRPEFWDGLRVIATDAYRVAIATPFLTMTKGQALEAGAWAGAPFWMSWSCYEGGPVHCGRCGTCVERAEAFAEAGLADPTEYADPEFWKTASATA